MMLLERHRNSSFYNHINSPQGENHTGLECSCSYCYGSDKIHYGLNIPHDKSWNSWWVIKFWPATYLRFTLPFLKRKKL